MNVEFMQNNRKSFSVGKAAGGAILTGGVGTLAGFAGKKEKINGTAKIVETHLLQKNRSTAMAKIKHRITKRKEQIRCIFHDRKPIQKRIALWIVLSILILDIVFRFGVFK